jgi:1,4-dihydroxy-2-naphthoyl-CoA synthase
MGHDPAHWAHHGRARRIEAVTMLYSTRDAAEGIRAFTERREPRFEGR